MSVIERMTSSEFLRRMPEFQNWEIHVADETHPTRVTVNDDEIKVIVEKGMHLVEEVFKLKNISFYRNRYTKSLVGKINSIKWIEGYKDD